MLRFGTGKVERVKVPLPVRVPEVPFTVTVKLPTLAVVLAVSVNVLEPAVLVGLKDAVTPLGKPVAVRATLALNPFCGFTVMVVEVLPPSETLTELGEADKVKLPALLTVNAIVVVLLNDPEVPVIVTLVVPIAAVLLAVNVTVLVLAELVGLKEAVTPLGIPEAEKPTKLEKPFRASTVMVLVPVLLRVMVTLLGEDERKNPGARPFVGQLATRLAAFTEPIPLAKSQPVIVPYAGL